MKKPNRNMVLLMIIFLSFASLGLPDGIIGVAWPAVRSAFGLPLEELGILMTLLLIMSALSSFFSGRIVSFFGTGKVVFISAVMTGSALLGYSISGNFLWLLLFTLPLGFGQGAVDSGLNRYVAEHYQPRHMNWTHCFWGVGATVGPLIMTKALMNGNEWRLGYRVISIIQLLIAAVIYLSILKGYWEERQEHITEEEREQIRINEETGMSSARAQVMAMLLFFVYSGMELSMGVWTSSVLLESRHMSVSLTGLASAFLYAMIMVGRLLSGFIVSKIGNQRMIRVDFAVALVGMICIGTVKTDAGAIVGIVLVGLGFASIFPGLMYETPIRFKKKVSNQLIGYQVGAASLGGSAVSSVIGVILSRFGLELLYPMLIVLLIITFVINEVLSRWAASATANREFGA